MNELEQEKMKIKIEKTAEKIKAMTPQEYDAFMKKLIEKVRLLEAERLDKKAKMVELQYKYVKETKLDDEKGLKITGITEIAMIALWIGAFYSEMQDDVAIYAGSIMGIFSGLAMSFLNTWAYEKKPLSKKLNDVRKKVLKAKLESLDKKLFELNETKNLVK